MEPHRGLFKSVSRAGRKRRSEVKFTRGQFVLFHKGSLKVRQALDRAKPGAVDTKKRSILVIRGENGQEKLTIRCSERGCLEIEHLSLKEEEA